ncbi:Mce family protein [Mycobacteroides abscessus subsp. abscessus]|nr:Mce family protein [Mycobacteroides abscessus subsp. abscessus]
MLNVRYAANAGAIVVMATALAASGCSISSRGSHTAATYCAVMDDAIGLYPGNSVTRKGVPVGVVDAIDRGAMSVTVRFSLDRGVNVPDDTAAATRAPTILADRSLELSGGDPARGLLQPQACIPLERTATAKSISEGLAAFNSVIRQTMDAGKGDTLSRLVAAASGQLDGNGPGLRKALSDFAGAVRDAGRDMATADQLIRGSSSLMTTTDQNWSAIDATLQHAAPVSRELAVVFTGVLPMLTALPPLAQALMDVTTHLHGIVWNTLDTAAKAVRLLSDHTGVIVMYAGTLPNIVDGVRNLWARVNFRSIPVLSPRVAAGPQDDGQVCARNDMNQKDHCGLFYGVPDGITSIDMLQLVLKGGVTKP